MRKPVSVLVYAVLGAAGCTPAQYQLDLGDGGRKDAKAADGAQSHTCSAATPSQSKGTAESCSCDRECRTGFCVDGVCCTTACGQTCMACNLPSSPGVCAPVPWGDTPNDPSVCAPSTPATCGQDGTCDGKGACRQFVQGTECKTGTCDGDSVTGILTCDGKGTCSDAQPISKTCPPYTCDPTTHQCASRCSTDAQCSAGHQCVAGSCGKSPNGADCTTNDGCSSGYCVDSVCCSVPCAGSCVSCAQTGSKGRCQPLPAGQADPACQASDRTTCGRNGLCDGFGSCTLFPENTVCGPSSCAGLSEITPRTCDGHGTCGESGLVDCSPFLCTNNACSHICTTDTDCEDGHQCVPQTINGVTTGTCGKMKPGQICADPTECESGQCVDGVCCQTSCTGACRSCNLPSSPGQCLNVAKGATDPRSTCKDLGATSCSTNGVCDGTGACQTYPAGTVCGSESCVAGVHSQPSTCNASGQCEASPGTPCVPYVCNGTTCYNICTSSSSQCVPGTFCVNSSCGLKPNGAECSAGTECKSSFCAQGVCCNAACTSACMSCDLPGSLGLCNAVTDGSPDPQGQCAETPQANCGTTGSCKGGECDHFAAGLGCKPAVCASISAETPASNCDGKGACATPANISCGSFVCDSGACKTICTEDTDCNLPDICANNSCGLKVNGAACTKADECQSGFCTEGVCCNTACSSAASGGLCKTCKATGTTAAGTCHNVPTGGSEPNALCVKTDVLNKADCSYDGTCDGNGACRPWLNGTGCRPGSCAAGVQTYPATCDNGACPAATTKQCGDYICDPNSPSCLAACTSDSACTNSLTCVLGYCGTKQGAGKTCDKDSDCSTGLVCASEGVCCDQFCAGGCQTCELSATKQGSCLPKPADGPPRLTTPATCPAVASGACGNNGHCDGKGGCEQQSTCTPSTCPSTPGFEYTMCSSGTCTGSEQACNTGYLCVSGACATGCTTGNASANCDAANGYGCIGGICQKKSTASSCTVDNECASGSCVSTGVGNNKICCANACAASTTPCGQDGTCNSSGQCYMPPLGTACGSACSGSTITQIGCDGAGNCNVNGTSSPCPNSTVCGSKTTCGLLKEPGAACTSNDDCSGGNCLGTGVGKNHVCCALPCADSSQCGPNLCTVDGLACQVHPKTDSCGATTGCYDSGSLNDGGNCDGKGGCVQATTSCAPYICSTGAGACAAACTVPAVGCASGNYCDGQACRAGTCATASTACASGYYCDGANGCKPKKADKTACAGGDECTNGNCLPSRDGGNICCHTGCPSGTACGTNNLCDNDTGACVDPTNQTCGQPAGCSADLSTAYGAGKCTASGTCNQGSQSCTPYSCSTSTGTCAGACTVPAVGCGPNSYCDGKDCQPGSCGTCVTGYYCDGANGCTLKKADKTACGGAGECANGNCLPSKNGGSICCHTGCPSGTACGTNNLCDNDTGACVDPTNQTCGQPAGCSADLSTAYGAGKCTASGTCNQGSQSCTPYSCSTSTGTCAGACTVPAVGCGPNSYCDGKDCQPGSCGTCVTGYYCDGANGCTLKKADKTACGGAGECANGNCLPSKNGGSICCHTGCPSGTACGTNNLCDNDTGACVDPTNQTCGQPVGCSADLSTAYGAGKCTASGTCNQSSQSCAPYSCSTSTGTCAGACTVPAVGCAGGSYCDGQACQAGTCSTSGAGCASGYYCDGANGCALKKADKTACGGAGECTNGNCLPSKNGGSICCHTGCPSGTACGTNNLCDNDTGACVDPTNQTCGQPVGCSADLSTAYGAGKCTASGTCNQSSQSCAPYSCSTSTGTCAGACTVPAVGCAGGSYCDGQACQAGTCSTSGAGCASGYYCDGANGCTLKKADKTACGGAGECANGNCLPSKNGGSICCHTGCPSGTACGTNNLCDNDTGACVDPTNQTCGQPVGCSADLSTAYGAGKCTASGTCNQSSQSCAPYSCSTSTGTCAGACTVPAVGCAGGSYCDGQACQAGTCSTSGAGCASGYYCDGANGCTLKKADKTACGGAGECANGNCLPSKNGGSICCHTGCPSGTACGTNNLCDNDTGACVDPTNQTCGQPVGCSADLSTAYGAGKCTASGTCNQSSQSCAPYNCSTSTGKCYESCADATACVPSYVCSSEGTCILPNSKADGANCSLDGECVHAHCVDGYCCDSICTATCMSCGLAGSEGTCTAVTSGADDLCLVSCVGNLITNGQCGPASGNVGQCAAAVPCDGGNVCADSTHCATDCSGTGSCASGYHCDNNSCVANGSH